MKYLDRFMELQLLGIQQFSHWIFGKPMPDDELRDELRKVERVEQRIGKTTLRGDALRFQVERHKLRDAILAPRR